MSDGVRVWEIGVNDSLIKLALTKMEREEQIEKWISEDVSVLLPDDSGLLVIGRQVLTGFGKRIDLLCIAANGDLVIVELKRDKTAREVTAQALDYASWVQDLDRDRIEKIAAEYLKQDLRDVCDKTFGEYPEILNERHSIKIVASEVDDSTERIIRYLSKCGININFVRFHLFGSSSGSQVLVRTFTVAPEESDQNVSKGAQSRRTLPKTLETRLSESTNDAVKAFIEARLADETQRKDRNLIALLYPAHGKIRFRARARSQYVRINQKGRFLGDEKYWEKALSNPRTKTRTSATEISFNLHTEQDLAFFQQAMAKAIGGFRWATSNVAESDGAESEDE